MRIPDNSFQAIGNISVHCFFLIFLSYSQCLNWDGNGTDQELVQPAWLVSLLSAVINVYNLWSDNNSLLWANSVFTMTYTLDLHSQDTVALGYRQRKKQVKYLVFLLMLAVMFFAKQIQNLLKSLEWNKYVLVYQWKVALCPWLTCS